MKILSIDLATKYYRDFGWALLESGSRKPGFPSATDLGLIDPPDAGSLAASLDRFCLDEGVQALLLDGPQAWRHPLSPIEHMRLCERVLNTPGRTGLPGEAKPKTYLPYICFSIEVFALLRQLGWSLLEENYFEQPVERLVIECFPSYSWRTLGLTKLPAKGRINATGLEPFRRALADVSGYELPLELTHDELQAAVMLPVGEALLQRKREALVLVGIDPIMEGGHVYEGWIPLPLIQ